MDNILKDHIVEIACNVLRLEKKEIVNDENNERKLLHLLISESNKALEFVTLIEDEFSIEFDDDDVDLVFFQDFNIIINRIEKYL